MLPVIIAGLTGAWLVHRTRPVTRVRSMTALGPRSGAVYETEAIVGTPIVIVRSDRAVVTLQKRENASGYFGICVSAGSDPVAVQQIIDDFAGEPKVDATT